MSDLSNIEPPAITVTLVHGTFAHNAQWTEEHSEFSESISRAVPGKVVLTRFQWTGANSHLARLRAGDELAAHLRNLIATYPNAKHHVIAHSHGGNVVMYGMRDKSVAAGISSLVCLSTPFITLKRRLITPSVSVLRELPNPLFACIFAAFLSFALGTVDTSVWLMPSLLIIGFVHFAVRKSAAFLSNRLLVRLQKAQDRLISQLSLPELEGIAVLVVQAHRDEAAWYLNLVDKISSIPYWLWSPRLIFWFAWGWIFLSLPWAIASTHLGIFGAYASETGLSLEGALFTAFGYGLGILGLNVALFILLCLFAQGTMVVWAKVFRGHWLGFGERNLVENWLVHIAASADPPNVLNDVDIRSFVVSGTGLRHAVYGDKAVRINVAEWIANVITQDGGRAIEGGER